MKVPKLHLLQLCFWLPPHSVRADLLDYNNFIQNFVKLSVMTRFFCVTCSFQTEKREVICISLVSWWSFFYCLFGWVAKSSDKAQTQVPSMFQHWAAPAPCVFSALAQESPKKSFCLCVYLLFNLSHSVCSLGQALDTSCVNLGLRRFWVSGSFVAFFPLLGYITVGKCWRLYVH